MSVEVTEKVNAVILEYASPTLKRLGFSKSGQRFWHRTQESIWVLEFQRGKYNQGSNGEFTLNLGVYHPVWAHAVIEIPRLSFMGPVKKKPAEQDCFIRERLDELYGVPVHLRSKGSSWWGVSSHLRIPDLGDSVVSAIEEFAIPWFQRLNDLQSGVEYLDNRYSGLRNAWLYKVNAMIGMGLLGETQRASELYKLARKDSPNRGAMDTDFRDWRKSIGI
ncbi:DUF4304 domain-containing protein [Acaryochloris sp. IP29b_bin.137]|uniref:DUF4304 domain-containing protein n=1 Tax=Acaryochloris sp. IP29b_bin.137 TaxID=2969217 RepID=UPI0026061FCE|nr:DUF4304 domain-containing protein [Acaryochloris sp. IP29b_bin.137]